jgi:hypothetical protein
LPFYRAFNGNHFEIHDFDGRVSPGPEAEFIALRIDFNSSAVPEPFLGSFFFG